MLKDKPRLRLVKSNIFEVTKNIVQSKHLGSTIIVPHVCNNIGLFGAGFAAAVRESYPIVATNFELLGRKTKLGYVQYVRVMKDPEYLHELIFANMIAQNGLKNFKNPRPLNYVSLVACMSQIKSYIHSLQKNDDTYTNIEIHAPKFGSGLAGGNWNFIEHIIEDLWTNIPTFIYELRK